MNKFMNVLKVGALCLALIYISASMVGWKKISKLGDLNASEGLSSGSSYQVGRYQITCSPRGMTNQMVVLKLDTVTGKIWMSEYVGSIGSATKWRAWSEMNE